MKEEIIKLAEQSCDSDLAFSLQAKEEAKKRMKKNPTPENIAAFRKARETLQEELNRASGAPAGGRVFKTQLDAVAYLQDAGYKVSKSQFNRDVKARKVPKNAGGQFEEGALLGYAAACLAPTSQLADSAMFMASADQKSADAELKKYQAARQKLKFEKEQGLLMARADHERELGARALFFKNEVRNFIHLHGPAIIHLVGGDEQKLRSLVAWWEEKTAIWLDTWSGERSFSLPDETEVQIESED